MRKRTIKINKFERETLLILSQDTGGAFEYLRQSLDKKVLNNRLVISVQGTGYASKTLLSDAKRALSGKSKGYPHAVYVMLVVDRDDDPGLASVIEGALGTQNIEVFVSVPCIEYYFMLHFGTERPAMNVFTDLIHYLRSRPGFENYSKRRSAVPIALLSDLAEVARMNASTVRSLCEQDGTSGPRSDLDLLFDAVDSVAEGGLDMLKQTKKFRDNLKFRA